MTPIANEIESFQKYLGNGGVICYILPCDYNLSLENHLLGIALLAKKYLANVLVCIPAHFKDLKCTAETVCTQANIPITFLNFANNAIEELIDLARDRQIRFFHATSHSPSVAIAARKLNIPATTKLNFFRMDNLPTSTPVTEFKVFQHYNSMVNQEHVLAQTKNMLKYQSHVQYLGWLDWVGEGSTAGTVGQGLRMEALIISLMDSPPGMRVKYQMYVQNQGWQNWKYDGEMAGTVQQALRTEGIRIVLEGAPKGYSVCYKIHQQNFGWGPWVKDGTIAGAPGLSYRLEAIRIKIDKN